MRLVNSRMAWRRISIGGSGVATRITTRPLGNRLDTVPPSGGTAGSDPDFAREKFFQGGREILDAVATFWDGLNQDRLNHVTA